jgi:Fe-S oxidoreductase
MPSATLSAVDLHTRFKQKAELVSAIVSNVETTREALEYCVDLCERKQACQLLISGCDDFLSPEAEALCDLKQEKIIAAPALPPGQAEMLKELSADKGIRLVTDGLRQHLSGIDIGLIVTYFFHGRDKAKNLVQNCINCGACKAVCAAGIDLPHLIKEIHAVIQDEEGHPLTSLLLGKLLRNRKLFHTLLRSAQVAQRPVTDETQYLRHLPFIFAREHNFRALPAIAEKPFRDRWEQIKPTVASPRSRVALFSGCLQDFVYPEQLEAALTLLSDTDVAVDFPMEQSCCGLPVVMMGEKQAARDVARQNIQAFINGNYDAIVTLCASCASHLKAGYMKLFADDPDMAERARQFADMVYPFSAYANDVLKMTPDSFEPRGTGTTYHAPCHLCRGLGVREAPHALIKNGGMTFLPAEEEETCCGFGGTYSGKFPHISAEILARKLEDFEKTGADVLVTECPGCIMQLRGGAKKRGSRMKVKHLAEALAENKR